MPSGEIDAVRFLANAALLSQFDLGEQTFSMGRQFFCAFPAFTGLFLDFVVTLYRLAEIGKQLEGEASQE